MAGLRLVLCLALATGALAQAAPAPAPGPAASAQAPGAASAPAANLNYYDEPIITVCVLHNPPFATCLDKNGVELPDDTSFGGFDIEFFKLVARQLGWPEAGLNLECYLYDELMADLLSKNSTCDLAIGGLNATPEREDAGLQFTWPDIKTGLSIMVRNTDNSAGMWDFFSYMTWEVWVLLVFSGIIVGFLTWVAEVGCQALNHDTKWISNVMWDTLGRPVQMRDYRLSSHAANLIALFWSLLAFLTFTMYVANLTANTTTNSLMNAVRGPSDLVGKRIISWDGYKDRLARYNIQIAKAMPWDTLEDARAMVTELMSSKEYDALVMDETVLEILNSVNCDVRFVGTPFDSLPQASVWPVGFNNSELALKYNQAAQRVLLDTLTYQALVDKWITLPPAPCKNSGVSSNANTVTLDMVSGLYIMLCIAMGVGAGLVAWHWIYKLHVGPWAHNNPTMQRWFPCYNPRSDFLTRASTFREDLIKVGGARRMNPKKPSGQEEVWDDRYAGASMSYLDGSRDQADVLDKMAEKRAERAAERAARAGGPLPPHVVQQQEAAQANAQEEYMAGVLAEVRRLQRLIAEGPPSSDDHSPRLGAQLSGHPLHLGLDYSSEEESAKA